MNKKAILTLMIPALAVTFLVLFAGCSKEKQDTAARETPPVAVETQRPQVGTITKWFRTTCELRSPLEANLSFPNGGRILELAVKEGDAVEAGQYLGRVDTAGLSAQYAALQSSVVGATRQAEAAALAVKAAESQVEMAQAASDQAETDYKRYESLYKDGVATQAEFEQVKLRRDSSKLALQGATDQTEAARSQASAAQAGVQAVRDQAGGISVMIDNGTLRAPFGGRIGTRFTDEGTVVGPGTPVYSLIGEGEDVANRLEIRLDIPESVLGAVTAGTAVYLNLSSCEKEIQTAVDHLGAEVKSDSRTVEVVAYLSRDSTCLLPGMFGTVRIPIEEHSNALLVPEKAVIELEDVKLIYIAQGETAARREVETGIRDEGLVEITSGIGANDEVIVVGNRFLADGAKITIHNKAEGTASTQDGGSGGTSK